MALPIGFLVFLISTMALGAVHYNTLDNVSDVVNKVSEIVANASVTSSIDQASQESAVSILNPALLQNLTNLQVKPKDPGHFMKAGDIVDAIMRGDILKAAGDFRSSMIDSSEIIVGNALNTPTPQKWHSLLKFINYLPKLPEKTKFLNSAFQLLNSPHESITFGCFVKLQMDSPAFREATDEEKAALIVVQLKLPDFVRDMFWGSVCIRSVHFDEFLSAETNEPFMKRRRVFTENLKRWSYRWQFEENNQCESYLIKNIVGAHEYLYAVDDGLAFDARRRRVYSWLPGEVVAHSDWVLEPLKNSTTFNIKNTEKNEYLYAAAEDYAFTKYKRQVFTWIPGDVDAQGEWEIESC